MGIPLLQVFPISLPSMYPLGPPAQQQVPGQLAVGWKKICIESQSLTPHSRFSPANAAASDSVQEYPVVIFNIVAYTIGLVPGTSQDRSVGTQKQPES